MLNLDFFSKCDGKPPKGFKQEVTLSDFCFGMLTFAPVSDCRQAEVGAKTPEKRLLESGQLSGYSGHGGKWIDFRDVLKKINGIC